VTNWQVRGGKEERRKGEKDRAGVPGKEERRKGGKEERRKGGKEERRKGFAVANYKRL